MKRKIQTTALLFMVAVMMIGLPVLTQAQDAEKKTEQPAVKRPVAKKPSPWIFGGNIILSFGNYSSVGISPMVGYYYLPNAWVGLGITYIYSWEDPMSQTAIGGRLFTQYYVVPQAFLKAQYMYYSYSTFLDGNKLSEYEVPYLLLGGGYRQKVGPKTYLEFEVLFDVLQDSNSAYGNWDPVWGVGIVVGL